MHTHTQTHTRTHKTMAEVLVHQELLVACTRVPFGKVTSRWPALGSSKICFFQPEASDGPSSQAAYCSRLLGKPGVRARAQRGRGLPSAQPVLASQRIRKLRTTPWASPAQFPRPLATSLPGAGRSGVGGRAGCWQRVSLQRAWPGACPHSGAGWALAASQD